MNTFVPSYYNDPIHPLNNTYNRVFSCSQGAFDQTDCAINDNYNEYSMNADGPPTADEFAIGGGAKSNMVPLPLDFVPGTYDVLCGRGKKNYNSMGNQRLRRIVESYVEQYSSATTRQDKSDILSAIVDEVRKASPDGGFIKQDPVSERWFEVGDFLAREKVSQCFRDALSFQYRSSKKFKHEKRRQRDKAAKVAKQKGQPKEAPGGKPAKKKDPPANVNPLAKKQSLSSVLREEPTGATAAYIPPVQGNVQPNFPSGAAMSVGHPMPSLFQGQQSQFGSPYDNAAFAGNRHTSWPQLFPPTSHIFNPIHTGVNTQNMIAQQQRRFSDAMATASHSAMAAHPFHNSEPNINWSAHMDSDASMFQQNTVASLHASFSGGMNLHHSAHGGGMAGPGMHYDSGMAMMSGNNMMPGVTGGFNLGPGAPMDPPASNSRRNVAPLARSGSNVSTTSATAIVARLESALPDLEDQDENPFEPVPLPDERGGNHQEQNDDDSILPDW